MSPLIILFFILIAALLYWQLILAEGAYLGRRVVAWLYDLVATRYNAIKQFTAEDDARFLGLPLALSLQGELDPIVLDVATGTSRLPLALCQQPAFHGRIIALDSARRMLHEAARYVAEYRQRVTWVWQSAVPLPFDDDAFAAVTCLEALEFMPDTRAALAECMRVLKPGGLLLVSNRIATGARLMPGKTFPKTQFESLLMALGLAEVTTQAWQFDYDLVWSIKPDRDEAECHSGGGCHSERSEESLGRPTAPPVWPRNSSSQKDAPAQKLSRGGSHAAGYAGATHGARSAKVLPSRITLEGWTSRNDMAGCHSERSEESLGRPTVPPVWPRDSSSHPSTPLRSAQDAPRNDTLLRCPIDRGPLDRTAAAVQCRTCARRYPIGRDGVIELLR
jgi:ubiquinone/menaquinone biosynthesis C-methylase UbiE